MLPLIQSVIAKSLPTFVASAPTKLRTLCRLQNCRLSSHSPIPEISQIRQDKDDNSTVAGRRGPSYVRPASSVKFVMSNCKAGDKVRVQVCGDRRR